jgi:hypothetical protein
VRPSLNRGWFELLHASRVVATVKTCSVRLVCFIRSMQTEMSICFRRGATIKAAPAFFMTIAVLTVFALSGTPETETENIVRCLNASNLIISGAIPEGNPRHRFLLEDIRPENGAFTAIHYLESDDVSLKLHLGRDIDLQWWFRYFGRGSVSSPPPWRHAIDSFSGDVL